MPSQSPSTDYTLPIRCIESVLLIRPDSNCLLPAQNLAIIAGLHRFCRRLVLPEAGLYFRALASFIDLQTPPMAGYFTSSLPSGTSAGWAEQEVAEKHFDACEFLRPTKTRAMVNLFLAPLQLPSVPASSLQPAALCITSTSVDEDAFLISALNGILLPWPRYRHLISARI
ncbi:unnamed protein product, partial [Protopolystoma xenopodis]